MVPIAEELEARIEATYHASGNRLGWRFLYSPISVLQQAEVAFVGLNPGGAEAEPNQLAMDAGSAYCREVWWDDYAPGCSPLQLQVQAVFAHLGVCPDEVLAGNLVPFRSPDWRSLCAPEEALSLGRSLWRDVLAAAGAKVVVAMGSIVRDELARILEIEPLRFLPTGWGRVRAARGEANGVTLIGLPHLSRYKIMGRAKSQESVNLLFDGLTAAGTMAVAEAPTRSDAIPAQTMPIAENQFHDPQLTR
jgi:hypothetical protein